MSRSDIVNVKEEKKEFKVGYWYKCVEGNSIFEEGMYYKYKGIFIGDERGGFWWVNGDEFWFYYSRFDVNSEWEDSTPIKLAVTLTGTLEEQTNDLTKQTEEKQTMSNANRRVVNVKLLDNDSGLPVEYALVAQYQGIVTEDSDAVVINEILLNKNIANEIAKHNEKRVAQTDLEILKRTGNDVKLRQVKLKDLTWIVSPA